MIDPSARCLNHLKQSFNCVHSIYFSNSKSYPGQLNYAEYDFFFFVKERKVVKEKIFKLSNRFLVSMPVRQISIQM